MPTITAAVQYADRFVAASGPSTFQAVTATSLDVTGYIGAKSGNQLRAYSATNSDYVGLSYDPTSNKAFLNKALVVDGAAGACAASQVCYGGTTQTTIGANGAASALTANPVGYIIVNVAGTNRIIPYYNA